MQDRETATGKNHADTLCWVLPRTRNGFLNPSDFEGGSQNRPFLKKITKRKEKKDVPKTALKTHYFLIDFSLNFGWIWVSFLMFFSYLYHSHMQPSKSSKNIVFPMNFNDFTLQRNMIFDDFPDLFRYQF